MAETGAWQLASFALIAIIFYVFMALDGYDMGIGMALPFISGEDADKRLLLDIVWPFWDGNELWAIIGGACIFAAFPPAFAALLGGLAPLIAALLVFVMYRAIAFEAWYKDLRRRRLWEFAFASGSFLLSFGFGALVGNLLYGLPLDAAGGYAGGFLTPFRPYPLLAGALVTAASLFHGAAYLRKKTSGLVRERAIALSGWSWAAYAGLGLAATAATALTVRGAAEKPLFWAGAAASGVALAWARAAQDWTNDDIPFYASLASLAGIWVAAASALFPFLVSPSGDGAGLRIAEAASPVSTLRVLVPAVLAGMAVVGVYTIFIFKVFKGKSTPEGEGY